ncbi:hypothetical protein D3C73_367560 [compost metagenome]
MCLVTDYQVPFRRRNQFLLKLLVTRQHIESSDQAVLIVEDIPRSRILDHVTSQNIELKGEFFPELILPLLNEATWRYDQAPFEIAASYKLLDQQAGHDGFARAGIVSQKESQRLPWQHLTINGADLVGERVDETCVDC